MLKPAGPIRGIVTAAVVVVLWSSEAAAQVTAQLAPGAPDPNTVHLRLGPVWVQPTLSLTNLGVDTNIFNKSEAELPQKDFNITFTPAVNLWLPIGPTWLNGSVREDLLWYQKFDSERSARTSYALGWAVPLSRMTLFATGSWLRTRERPGFEIDARADRTEHTYAGGAEIRALSRTFFGVRAEHRAVDYVDDQVFLGRNLDTELKRTETLGAVTARHELTPFTSLTFDVSREQNRFEFATVRDADATQLAVGVAFTPDAIISGSAKVGFQKFDPTAADVEEYTGSTMAVNLTYAARDTTRFTVQSTRDVQFSFDVNQPYYVLTGVAGTVLQQLFGPFDVQGRLSLQRLAYRNREGVSAELEGRVDRQRSYGTGVGFRVGEDLRLGINVDHLKRSSQVAVRSYSGLRFGVSATYGF